MKNVVVGLLGLAFAVFVGLLFMDSTKNEETVPVINTNNQAKAFQLGAYNNLESANKEASLHGGKVIQDENYYYVYYSILQEQSNIEKMLNYLDKNNISYYLKNIEPDQSFLSKLTSYEELMKSTTSEIAFLELNKRIIESYEG